MVGYKSVKRERLGIVVGALLSVEVRNGRFKNLNNDG